VIFSKRQFYYSLGALLIVLLALNAVVACTTRNSIPRRLLARARQAPDTSVLAIGNSLIAAGVNESVIDASMQLPPGRGSLNFALGYSTPVEQLLFLRYALEHRMHPRLIVYGFYDLQLSTPIRLTTRELLGNRAVLYYLEPEYARQFYYLSPHDRVEFEIMRHFPMMVDRSAFWAKIELLRRDIGQQGMPHESINQFGRADDFSLLEWSSPENFAQACERASGQDLIAPVLEIIRQGSESGAKLVFVEMPMRPAHVRSFYDTPAWRKYREHVRDIVEPRGVRYIDASHWIDDASLFADALHLGNKGAAQFSQRLGEELRTAPPAIAREPVAAPSQR
jgi:hypothetical protein